MDTNKLDIKARLSTLWIVVMVNIIMADIFSATVDAALGDAADVANITQGMMLGFAFIQEIPIIMIFLSRVMKYKANRWANIVASVITIAFVIAGYSAYLHYYFFAAVETVCLLLIIRDAWKWTEGKA